MFIQLIYINISLLLSSFSKQIGFTVILLTLFNIFILWPRLQSDGDVDILRDSRDEVAHIFNSFYEQKKNDNKTALNDTILAINNVLNEAEHKNHVQDQIGVIYYFVLFSFIGKSLSVCLFHPPLINDLYLRTNIFYCVKILFTITGFVCISLLGFFIKNIVYFALLNSMLGIIWSFFSYIHISMEEMKWQTKKSLRSTFLYYNVISMVTNFLYIVIRALFNEEKLSENNLIHIIFVFDMLFIIFLRLRVFKNKKPLENMKLYMIDQYNANLQRNYFFFLPEECDFTTKEARFYSNVTKLSHLENTELQRHQQQNNDSGSGDGSTNSKEEKISRNKNGSPRRSSTSSFLNTSPRDVNLTNADKQNCLSKFICLFNPFSYYLKYRTRMEQHKLQSGEMNNDVERGNDNFDTRNKSIGSHLSTSNSSLEQTSYTSNGLSSSTLKKKNAKQNTHNGDNISLSSNKFIQKQNGDNPFINDLEHQQQQQQRESMYESKKNRTKILEKTESNDLFSHHNNNESSLQTTNLAMTEHDNEENYTSRHETLAEANARMQREKEEKMSYQQSRTNGKARKTNATTTKTKELNDSEQPQSSFHNTSTSTLTFNETNNTPISIRKKKKSVALKKSEELQLAQDSEHSSMGNDFNGSSVSQYHRDRNQTENNNVDDDVVFNNETLVL